MTKSAAAAVEGQHTPQAYNYTRLAALTCMPVDGLQTLFAESILPEEALKLKQRAALFVRLCVVRLLKSGIDPILVPDAAGLLAGLFDHADPIRSEAWLLLYNEAREIVTTRAYMIDALARAKAEAIVVLDIGDAWRATS